MTEDDVAWLDPNRFLRIEQARDDWRSIQTCGATGDLLNSLQQSLSKHLPSVDDWDGVLSNLARFVAGSRSPTALLALFERDENALLTLLKIFSTGQILANRLITDPESFDLMRASDGQPAERKYLVDEIVGELETIDAAKRASLALRKFNSREMIRIAYGEFVRDLSPSAVGSQLAYVADALIEAALAYSTRALVNKRQQPILVSGELPQVTVIGLGNLGGQELGYGAPLQLLFLYDQIDEKNPSHRDFYEQLVRDVIDLLGPDEAMTFHNPIELFEIRKTSGDSAPEKADRVDRVGAAVTGKTGTYLAAGWRLSKRELWPALRNSVMLF